MPVTVAVSSPIEILSPTAKPTILPTLMSLAEKTMAEQQKTGYRDSALEQLEEAKASLDRETQILQKAISELIELLPVCVDTGMTYEERVALREEEIEGLKKALCVLQNYNTDAMEEC